MRGLGRLPSAFWFRALRRVPPDARGDGHAAARRAGARRRTAKTGRWLRPIRLGIGASNCATRSAPSSNSCAEPSRSCARNSIRRTGRSEAADSAIRTQARHSGSSPKPVPGAAVVFGRRCENVSCCKSQRTRRGGARDQPAGESVSDHVQGGPVWNRGDWISSGPRAGVAAARVQAVSTLLSRPAVGDDRGAVLVVARRVRQTERCSPHT
jgi:hypothetical protein